MKKLFLIFALLCFTTWNIEAATGSEQSTDGGQITGKGVQIGGWDPTHGHFNYLEVGDDGNLVIAGGAGGGAMTVADGADVTQGAIADAAVAAGATGTISAKLRRISTDLATNIANTALGTAAPASSKSVTQATATTVVSSALEASHVMLASSGRLVSITVLNTKASLQYILIMNSATVPSDGAVTLLFPPIPVPANTLYNKEFPTPLTASTGISVSNSSTGTFTKTIGSADCIFEAQVQ